MDPDWFNIVHKKVNSHCRTIKEAMFICIHDPTLNRNLARYQLLHIWDHLLQASPTLQLEPSILPAPPPHPPNHPPFLIKFPPSCYTYWQGAYTFLGKYPMLRSNTTPNTPKLPKSPYKLHPLQQHHLGKFLIFIC